VLGYTQPEKTMAAYHRVYGKSPADCCIDTWMSASPVASGGLGRLEPPPHQRFEPPTKPMLYQVFFMAFRPSKMLPVSQCTPYYTPPLPFRNNYTLSV